jgi:hypothetical protein
VPDGTAASQAETLAQYASVIAPLAQCHAVILRRYAEQIRTGVSAADAVTAWTDVPGMTEPTLADVALADVALTEPALVEPVLPV